MLIHYWPEGWLLPAAPSIRQKQFKKEQKTVLPTTISQSTKMRTMEEREENKAQGGEKGLNYIYIKAVAF
jgi:hypothetical protein